MERECSCFSRWISVVWPDRRVLTGNLFLTSLTINRQCLAGDDCSSTCIDHSVSYDFQLRVTTYQPEQIRRVIDHGLLYQSLIDECAGGRRLTVGGLGDRLVGGHMYLLIGPVLQVRLAKKLNYVPCLASQLTSTATVHRVRNGIGRYLSLNSSCTVTREVLRDPSSDVVYKRRPFLCAPQTICVSIQN